MKSIETSFSGLFRQDFDNGLKVRRIEVPLLQRDFAQGRPDAPTTRIRGQFLEALIDAASGAGALSLDFVYGDLDGDALLPLDGQQRLTTLFLLHWYLAVRNGRLGEDHAWKNFTYSTRASARLFCERIGQCSPELDGAPPSCWLRDQPWYLQTWQHDPTIQSMLVVLDDIHLRMTGKDCGGAWQRLVEATPAAITFHVLPMKDMGLSDDVYIKMNSRGKPLTEFEMFKARFEKLLESRSATAAHTFATRIDTVWADVFWACSKQDGAFDRELLRYLRFATDVCEWESGRIPSPDVDEEALAAQVYGRDGGEGKDAVALLFSLLDVWVDTDIPAWFSRLVVSQHAARSGVAASDDPLILFRPLDRNDCNLFAACCSSHDSGARNRDFGWPEVLLFYALLLHKVTASPQVHRRLRIVRNLIEGSPNELRADRVPALMQDVRRIMADGSLREIVGFNQKIHAADERLKADFIEQNPHLQAALRELEDHALLRGCLVAFHLDASTFARRARNFIELFASEGEFPLLTAALLAAGDYAICIRGRVFLLGSSRNSAPWRDVLTASARDEMGPTRDALGRLLDHLDARGTTTIAAALQGYTANWLLAREGQRHFDWRYYLVQYDAMREGASGRYVGSEGKLGYSLCMLNKIQMNSYYRDPYLHAIRRASGMEEHIDDCLFTGYETEPRWMPLKKSGIALRAVQDGFRLRIPIGVNAQALAATLAGRRAALLDGQGTLHVAQAKIDSELVDTEDRIELGAALLRDLVGAGF